LQISFFDTVVVDDHSVRLSPQFMDLTTQLQESLGNSYKIERELGAGGMSRVFLAREIALGRHVVIKVLPPEMSSVVLSERFRREISLAAQLRHPHIIPLLTAGDAGGLLYYTMPFVEGETLRARLMRDKVIPVAEGVRIIREIAYALSYAHAHNVVHRDIKPENVLIENGHAVVADFGVAKALASAAGSNESEITSITTAGTAMGTAMYMAPEQAAADPAIDHRADLYALGVVAYEILTGEPPFTGSQHQVVVAHMVNKPEAIDARRPEISPALAALVMRLLEKKPEDRPQSADEVVGKLDAIAVSRDLSSGEVAPSRADTRARSRKPLSSRAVAGVAALAVLLIAAYAVQRIVRVGDKSPGDPPPESPASAAKSVAVLPFANTSGDIENKHFSDGLTDELISALGAVQGLKVAARTSVFALADKGLSARAIADTLGVATVIEGSARRIGNRLKVNAQLVGASDGTVMWTQSFDRELVDVFAVQEEIARAIVFALNVRLTEDVRTRLSGRPTMNVDAYDAYLKGRYSWGKRNREGIEAAIAYYQSAVELDPKFALPYSGMSDAYVALGNFNYMPAREAFAHAETAADRALSADSSLAEAHASKGFVLSSHGKYAEADRELRRALELNPSYASGHHFYTLLLLMTGRLDEATEQNRLTVSLDPLSVPGNATTGIILCQRGKYAEARPVLQRALLLSTGNPLAPFYLGALEAADGQYAKAIPLLERANLNAPGFAGVKGGLAYVYSRAGRRAASDSILADLRSSTTDDRSRIQLGFAEAAMGNLDRAYEILENPSGWDVPTVIELRADPLLARLRADARYSRLLSRIGIR
jgi:serine/threonine-protein kinase